MNSAPSLCLTSLAAAVVLLTRLAAAEPGLGGLTRLDGLARLRESIEVGAITSYDRTGGNDDGFSGTYSFVRKEGDALVLADLKGPGVITRFATPTPIDAPIEFYFDGETTPRLSLPFRKLFDGSTAPFLAPLVDRGHGGNWSYVPIPYAKSCKVVIRAPKVQFYQINYATFAEGTPIKPFVPAAIIAGSELEQARDLIGRTGQDLSAWTVPDGTPLRTERKAVSVAPGQTVLLFDSQQGGRIAGFRLGPAAALAGPDRGLVLQMTWDGASTPAVLCPAGDFFGFSWGRPSMRSLLIGTDHETCYSYFPMPYDRSARIELRSERTDGAPVEVTAEIVYADLPRRPDEGRFNAMWRRENPTTSGQPFTFVAVKGRGHLVGVTLQAEGEKNGSTGFFEGDDHAFIDGKLAVNGTGSEDFFNGGWYDVPGQWETRTSHPLNGCLDYLRPISRSGGYRLLLGDAYAFRQSLVVDIEHAPEKNTLVNDYTGVSYLYLAEPSATQWTLPVLVERGVTEVDRLVYSPGWFQPPVTFSIQHGTLTKKEVKIGEASHRVLSLDVAGPELLGEHHIAFFCDVPDTGRYRVSLEMIEDPRQGGLQLCANGQPVVPVENFHAEAPAKGKPRVMGDLDLTAGFNRVFFKVSAPVGTSGPFALEFVTLTLERIR